MLEMQTSPAVVISPLLGYVIRATIRLIPSSLARLFTSLPSFARIIMPLYELFCLTRPAAGRKALAEMIKTAGTAVIQKGGVLTDVTFYGEQKLAYEIRDTTGKFDKVEMALVCASPAALHHRDPVLLPVHRLCLDLMFSCSFAHGPAGCGAGGHVAGAVHGHAACAERARAQPYRR